MKLTIIANWKCNPSTLKEAKELFNLIKERAKNSSKEIIICPPFIYLLPLISCKNKPKNLKLGAQNCFFKEGPFTGEISPLMLKNLGIDYVILGHSERRKLGEKDEMINEKVKAALKSKLKVILCIGETDEERKLGKTFEILKFQLEKDLFGISENQFKNILLAYEPVWAIGTKNPCQVEDLKKVVIFLKSINKKFKILYGGSVNKENFSQYLKVKDVSGLLVGGASLNHNEFLVMIS